MGFEQLAKLKEQLAKEASAQRKQKAAAAKPASNRQAGKPAGKPGEKTAEKAGDKPGDKQGERRAHRHAADQAGAGKHVDRLADKQADKGAARPNAKQNPVDPVVHTIGKLQKRFPAAFPKNPAPKVALKIGILEDLLAQAGELKLTEQEIRDAVSTWCRGSRYWACLTEGAARVDLSGAEAGKVTASDSAFARRRSGGRTKPAAKAEGDATAVASDAAAVTPDAVVDTPAASEPEPAPAPAPTPADGAQ